MYIVTTLPLFVCTSLLAADTLLHPLIAVPMLIRSICANRARAHIIPLQRGGGDDVYHSIGLWRFINPEQLRAQRDHRFDKQDARIAATPSQHIPLLSLVRCVCVYLLVYIYICIYIMYRGSIASLASSVKNNAHTAKHSWSPVFILYIYLGRRAASRVFVVVFPHTHTCIFDIYTATQSLTHTDSRASPIQSARGAQDRHVYIVGGGRGPREGARKLRAAEQ